MQDLDILLEHYAGISHIPAYYAPDSAAALREDPCLFYTRNLSVEPGHAGYVITDEYLFCGKIVHKHTGKVILLGPATEHPLSSDTISRIAKEMGHAANRARELRSLLGNIPLVSVTLFWNHLSFLNYIINGSSDLLPRSAAVKSSRRRAPAPSSSVPVYHNTAQFEKHIMECIEYGRLDLIQPMLEEANMAGHNMGNVSNDSIRALKNIFITSTTLACRAAVQGGLDYDRAMTLSDAYLRQCEQIQTYDGFYRLFTEMITDLTKRTKDLRLHSNCSQLVRDVARDINRNLNQKITVEQLAMDHNVSSSYLSHHFRRETGKRLTDYIAQQKIDEAIRLLKSTDMTLAQIAYQLSFSSQSYFHATFKKITGVSPGKYPRIRTQGDSAM